MNRIVLCAALFCSVVGCQSIRVERVLSMTGAASSGSLAVQCVDPRTGDVYSGEVTATGGSVAPLGAKPLPAIVTSSGSEVVGNVVIVKETP